MTMTTRWQCCEPSRLLLHAVIFLAFTCHWFALATMPGASNAKFYTIYWNSSNPIFRIDNTDNVIDVNRNNVKFEYDQVDLICPVYSPGTRDEEIEKYIIYNVSKEEYETCRITNANPRIIAVCDKPYKLMYFTITFRPFTPQPGGLEFLPGQDYYFISTSTSDDPHRRIGGRCTTHNMKIIFKVWGPPSTPATAVPPPITAKPSWWSVPSPRTTTSSTTWTTPTTVSSSTTTKKSKTYNKHPNEVVKSEELTLGGGAPTATNLIVVACLAALFIR
ncbi:ephrin-A4 [Diorhabda carinulata]|uniref:ephrin-A4 n=1 Tax=Diorhabda carinulata TaxID=1163345 RepID=UPI0025A13B90|nr:ephrin-A4 [Diorhabda carinulata]XP_057652705.1 ephrin-A4 [Diorhabda carinulata]XP_057652706.1 ephrin-A4 [Diorhabda carinulata]XP_057652708.1 ephrin-A4 [Diorhabda carinulata]XP_057652709.1 ephrin-A4 [Diorhabda carinulata]XP_057652710.1 ephrin-A4 [Diorhabda carinulata]XP_057652711.1 ephrin-A4 [Diorhabda carinulata]